MDMNMPIMTLILVFKMHIQKLTFTWLCRYIPAYVQNKHTIPVVNTGCRLHVSDIYMQRTLVLIPVITLYNNFTVIINLTCSTIEIGKPASCSLTTSNLKSAEFQILSVLPLIVFLFTWDHSAEASQAWVVSSMKMQR